MSHIEGSIGGAGLAGELMFVATAARLPAGGHAGVRSAMARAAQLLAADAPASRAARHASTDRIAGSLRPARRRTRRYSERHRLPV